jgi:hypothetical protein
MSPHKAAEPRLADAGSRIVNAIRRRNQIESDSRLDVTVRLYPLPRPSPQHTGAVIVAWTTTSHGQVARTMTRTGGTAASHGRSGGGGVGKVSLPVESKAKQAAERARTRVRLNVPLEGAGTDAGLASPGVASGGAVVLAMDPENLAASDMSGDYQEDSGAGVAGATGLAGDQGSVSRRGRQLVRQPASASRRIGGAGASGSKRSAAMSYRRQAGTDEGPIDDHTTFVSGMSKSSATKRSLKRSLDTMAKSKNVGIERLRAMLWFAVAAFASLTIVAMLSLGPWAVRIRLHSLSLDNIGQTVQLIEDINFNVGLLARQHELQQPWPVTNISANVHRLDSLPAAFSTTTKLMYSQLRSIAGDVLAFMVKSDSVRLEIIPSASTDAAASRALAIAAPTASSAATGTPRMLTAGTGVLAPAAATGSSSSSLASSSFQMVSGFDALAAVQAAAEALRGMAASQIRVGNPDVDFLQINARKHLTPALNSTIELKFVALIAELELIRNYELWTAITAVAFSVVCQLVGSIAAAQRMHHEEVMLLRVFYHIPIDIAQALVHKSEARLRKHRKFTSGPDGDGGNGDDAGDALVGRGEAGGTDAGSDDSDDRRQEDEEDMKWQLILDKHAKATRFRQTDAARNPPPSSAASAGRKPSSADTPREGGDGSDSDSRHATRTVEAVDITSDVLVSDSRMLRQTQVALTIVPSIILVFWFLTIFLIEAAFHESVIHDAERVVHMRELTTWTSAHTYTMASASLLYTNNSTERSALLETAEDERGRILFRLNHGLHGGKSPLEQSIIESGHTLTFDLAPTREGTDEYAILVENACPAAVSALSRPTSFYSALTPPLLPPARPHTTVCWHKA